MGTLVDFRAWLRTDLNDPLGANQRFADPDLERAVTRAVAALTEAAPLETDTEHTVVTASRTVSLAGAPYAGALLDVCEVEHPYGAGGAQARYPPQLVPFRVSPDRTRVLLLSDEVPAVGSVLRLRWAAAHLVTAASSTVPLVLDPLVALGAAGHACLAYSTPTLDNFKYEDGASVSGVDDSMIGNAWQERGRVHLERFAEGLESLRRRRALDGQAWVNWGSDEESALWPLVRP